VGSQTHQVESVLFYRKDLNREFQDRSGQFTTENNRRRQKDPNRPKQGAGWATRGPLLLLVGFNTENYAACPKCIETMLRSRLVRLH